MIPAFPKPGQIKRDKPYYREFDGGRIVYDMNTKRGRDEYASNVRKMWERQKRVCGLQISPQCKARQGRLLIDQAQFDHDSGRGHGGAKRDDRIEKLNPDTGQMEPFNSAVCCFCNVLKGSRSVKSVIDEFIP